jgi:hypothetical protein
VVKIQASWMAFAAFLTPEGSLQIPQPLAHLSSSRPSSFKVSFLMSAVVLLLVNLIAFFAISIETIFFSFVRRETINRLHRLAATALLP